MGMQSVELPEELLDLLAQTKLAACDEQERVRIALAAFLFQQGVVKVGAAARLAGWGRSAFELLLGQMGIPTSIYTREMYDDDTKSII